MLLPEEFIAYTRPLLGEEIFNKLLSTLAESSPVSIRFNPFKADRRRVKICEVDRQVAWCKNGFYLNRRPNFTFDPLFHMGLYYVQEAASMFVHQVIHQYTDTKQPVTMLDLCAAPGGKSTAVRAALPDNSLLFCNDPVGQRAQILVENLQKFGHPDVIVTNNLPRDYQKAGVSFDIILADVPCSGEGLFRKDSNAVAEWSLLNVEKCWQLQREIVRDIWPCLKTGGILVYSTCTFNNKENEDNIEWILRELDAEILPVHITADWHITGSLTTSLPVYRFMPGVSRSEGLFMAVLRKREKTVSQNQTKRNLTKRKYERNPYLSITDWLVPHCSVAQCQHNETLLAIPNRWKEVYSRAAQTLKVLHAGVMLATFKGKDIIPHQSLALSILLNKQAFPCFEVSYAQAISFLRKEAIPLPPHLPKGFILLVYQNIPLGFEKNIGHRANNLYPPEWRIKSTYLPEENNTIIQI